MAVAIRPIPVPAALGTPEARAFEAGAELDAELERECWGHDDFTVPAAELLPRFRATHERRVAFGAWDDEDAAGAERLVGRAWVVWDPDPEATTVELGVGVARDRRRLGIGRALLARTEEFARSLGRDVVAGYTDHAGTGGATAGAATRDDASRRLIVGHDHATTAWIPADAPAARFALAAGYGLAQIERVSLLETGDRLPGYRMAFDEARTRAAAAGYLVAGWLGPTPEHLVDAVAAAREHMARDVPAGDLTIDPERWDAARVRDTEQRVLASGTGLATAIAIAPDGAIAGYTVLELPPGRTVAHQDDTLVVAVHRGHGLGMLLKLANLVRVADEAPERTRVYTWNADENEHMLAINEALGFRPCGRSASWERRLAAPRAAGTAGSGATTDS